MVSVYGCGGLLVPPVNLSSFLTCLMKTWRHWRVDCPLIVSLMDERAIKNRPKDKAGR